MPILYVSLTWLAGILAGSIFTLPAWLLALPLPVLPLVFLMPNHLRSLALLALCLLAFPAGALVYQSSIQPIDSTQAQFYNGKGSVLLTGIIDDEPEVKGASVEFKLAAAGIGTADNTTSVKGGVLVSLPFYRSFQYGDALELSGKLETPMQFGDFDYRGYLENRGIYSVMNYPAATVTGTGQGLLPLTWIYGLRSSLSNSLSACLPEPQSSLASAILLGLRGSLPLDLVQSFYVTGTTHLIAISGMNLTILLGMILALTIWILGRKNKAYFWIALAFIWLYTVLTGMPATMVRAAVMGSIFLAAELLGRQRNGLAALVLSAALMTAAEPRVLWDISFQLSFLSMLGLVLIAPYFIAFAGPQRPATKSLYPMWIKEIVVISFGTTLAAVIATWPLTALNFHSFSLVSAPATFFSMPSFPGIIVTSLLTAVAGLAWPPLGMILGWIAWLFLSYFLFVVQIFSSLPAAYIRDIVFQPWQAALYYIALGVVLLCIKYRLHIWNTMKSAWHGLIKAAQNAKSVTLKPLIYWLVVILLAGNILISIAIFSLPDGRLHVSILDVGQGESILIRTPDGRNILVDSGPNPASACIQLGKKLPFWDRRIDMLILTQFQSDHIAGSLELLKRYDIGWLGIPPSSSSALLPAEIIETVKAKQIALSTLMHGKQVNAGGDVLLTVLNPPAAPFKGTDDDANNNSIVIRVSYGKVSFLLCSDIGVEAERYLADNRVELQSDVLKVAHHGSKGSSSDEFLAIVKPASAAISAGAVNRFGHPSKEALARLAAGLRDGKILVTAIHGNIEYITDGQKLWYNVEKPLFPLP